jgi:glycine oxidase
VLGRSIWHPMPIVRLAGSVMEWQKIGAKLTDPAISPWIGRLLDPPGGWVGAIEVVGGGRLDTRTFLEASREFFLTSGRYHNQCATPAGARDIVCTGAAALLAGLHGAHRSAKGEILTLEAPDWDDSCIVTCSSGWLVPLGNGQFKCGSTYEWKQLDELPTPEGRATVESIAAKLGSPDFRVLAHEAAIRPILRNSEPLIGPQSNSSWMFNGLGSKGSLYAPGVVRRLADWLLLGIEPEPVFDVRKFINRKPLPHECR